MANAAKKDGSSSGSVFSTVAIIICLVIGYIVWKFIMGDAANFEGGDPDSGHPKNLLGTVYKGGFIVPILLGFLLMVVVFSIERFLVISKAAGKGNLDKFMKKVQSNVAGGDIEAAIEDCDKQEGSVANAIKAALVKFRDVKKEGLDSEHAAETIQKEIEEATTLEMPMLEKHMTILSTMVSLGTLGGLLGTVSGMIKAFSALSSGTPDQSALAVGISEALINTFTGISTSALAIITYNLFTSKIDTLTHLIDEAGFAIVATYRKLKG
jgi:biopolymer transport protein ExbB